MSVLTSTNRVDYTADGVQVTYSFAFAVYTQSDLQVYVTPTGGTSVLKSLNVDYTQTAANVPGGNAGGSIIFAVAPTNNYQVTLIRKVPILQQTTFTNLDKFDAKTAIEGTYDKVVMIEQQLNETLSRAPVLPVDSILNPEFPLPGASKFIRWNSGGTALEAVDITGGALNATMDAFNAVNIAGLPTAGQAGRARYVTNSTRGLWIDQGNQFLPVNGGWCNVKEFGAVGNGTTDDTASIQAAIDAGYGSGVYFPPGNYLISSALSVIKPIQLAGPVGALQGATNYGARILTNTAGIHLLDIDVTEVGGNDVSGGLLRNLKFDGNSKATICLNVTGAYNNKWSFYDCVFVKGTHLGTYVDNDHSFRFYGCTWALNGITSNTVNDGGIQIDGANAVHFYGCNSEANYGSGVIFSAGYSMRWHGGVIEGNQHHGVYGLGTAQHVTISDTDFEGNNVSTTASRYDVNISLNANAYWELTNLKFAGTATTYYVNNNGGQTMIRNCRGITTANNILWTVTGDSGLFEGDVKNQIASASVIASKVKVNNTNPQGFGYTTPAVPSTTVFSTAVNTNIRVYITDIGTTTAYTIKDPAGLTQVFAVPLEPGQLIDLPAGATLAITYTGVPSWKWYEY